jgi:xanthine dehydrogenase accessory factor
MKELQNIINAFETSQHCGQRTALATVVKTSGSVYRRPGARMLMTENGRMVSAISGGCLESDVFERSQALMFYGGDPVIVKYDPTSDDKNVQDFGLGCNGIIYILIESLEKASAKSGMAFIADCYERGETGVIATVLEVKGKTRTKVASRLMLKADGTTIDEITDRELARRVLKDACKVLKEGKFCLQLYTFYDRTVEVFIEVIQPPVPLLIFGAGYDGLPLASFGKQLGWHVTVIDRPPGYGTRDRFNCANRLVFCSPEELSTNLTLNSRQVAVVMTHNYQSDRALLRTLLPSPFQYLGLLGSKNRTQRLLKDLQAEGLAISQNHLCRLHSPVGLDIGADTPEEIALSIMAEIQAVLSDRSGGSLRKRQGSIHGETLKYLMSV